MATYKTNDFRKGLKVQIDGEPYLMFEMNFVKPGKGNAFYKCKLRNLIRNTVLVRTYKGGESLESADVEDLDVQYIYRQGDTFVFMNEKTYEQYELTADQVDDNWRYLIEGLKCSMVIYNGLPITITLPKHVELTVEYCEPGAKGDTATNVTGSPSETPKRRDEARRLKPKAATRPRTRPADARRSPCMTTSRLAHCESEPSPCRGSLP